MPSLSSTRSAGSSSVRVSSSSRSVRAVQPALARAGAGEVRQLLPVGGNCRRRRLGLFRSTSSSSSSSSTSSSSRSPPPLSSLLVRSTSSSSPSRSLLVLCRAGLKLTESFDASLPLDDERREALFSRLSDPNFCAQVSLETTRATKAVEFTGKVFTPVPWSPGTPKGMPAEYEEFANDAENYVVINVPPTLTFKAKVFGKRVCAVYRIVGDAE